MNNKLKAFVFLVFILVLMFGLAQTALAAETFVTTTGVNFRREDSLDAEIIRVLPTDTRVEVLNHDPAGWSTVRVNGTTGYIWSDYITLPADTFPRIFRTTDAVRFRTEPTTDSRVIRVIPANTRVEVLEHDPAGWSSVRFNDRTGYIRSDLLFRFIGGSAENAAAEATSSTPSGSSTTLWTNAGVNLRERPSTDSNIISTVVKGTAVTVIDHNPTAWSAISINGTIGHIRSDFLSESNDSRSNVELVEWSVVKNMLSDGQIVSVQDVLTGRTFNVRIFTRGRHADVDAATRADADTIKELYGGNWSWDRRAVWVTIDDRVIAASMNGMPHGNSGVANNGMNGHICIHFLGSTHHNGGNPASHQAKVQEAYRAGQ